jgi:hypothetical protein
MHLNYKPEFESECWPRLGEADIRGLRLGLDMVLNEWTVKRAVFFLVKFAHLHVY